MQHSCVHKICTRGPSKMVQLYNTIFLRVWDFFSLGNIFVLVCMP